MPSTLNAVPRFSPPTSPAFCCGPSLQETRHASARYSFASCRSQKNRPDTSWARSRRISRSGTRTSGQLFESGLKKFGELLPAEVEISEQRRLLIGAYFLAEYSLESAALFNPSIVPHLDQAGLAPGSLRFILSLRATGEGHISSITFRTGVIHPDNQIEMYTPVGFLTEPVKFPTRYMRSRSSAENWSNWD